MCRHSDDDWYDCLECCYDSGYDDALDGFYDNPYKNWDQVEEYNRGYDAGLAYKDYLK